MDSTNTNTGLVPQTARFDRASPMDIYEYVTDKAMQANSTGKELLACVVVIIALRLIITCEIDCSGGWESTLASCPGTGCCADFQLLHVNYC
jgi:hypothetical protein